MKIRNTFFAATVLLGATLANAPAIFAQEPGPATPGQNPGQARRQRMNRGGQQGNPMMGGPMGMLMIMNMRENPLMLTTDQQTKFRELSEKFNADLKALLTPEQQTKLDAEMARMAQGGPGAGGPGAGGPGGMNLMDQLADLNLTSDQKTQVQPIVEDTMKQLQGLRNAAPQERRQQMRTIIDGFKGKVRPLLTPDQQVKFDTMQIGMGGRGGGGRRPGGGQAPPPASGADF